MPGQFENPEEKKVQDETSGTHSSEQERIDRVAEKAAEKGAKEQNRYDKEHNIVSEI